MMEEELQKENEALKEENEKMRGELRERDRDAYAGEKLWSTIWVLAVFAVLLACLNFCYGVGFDAIKVTHNLSPIEFAAYCLSWFIIYLFVGITTIMAFVGVWIRELEIFAKSAEVGIVVLARCCIDKKFREERRKNMFGEEPEEEIK